MRTCVAEPATPLKDLSASLPSSLLCTLVVFSMLALLREEEDALEMRCGTPAKFMGGSDACTYSDTLTENRVRITSVSSRWMIDRTSGRREVQQQRLFLLPG